MPRKGVREALTLRNALVGLQNGDLGPIAVSEEVPIFVSGGPTLPRLRMMQIHRDAAAVLLSKDEETGQSIVGIGLAEDLKPERRSRGCPTGRRLGPSPIPRRLRSERATSSAARSGSDSLTSYSSG